MANKHYTRKGKKLSRKNIRSKKVKSTRKQINKKKTRKQRGGVQRPETLERERILMELMPTHQIKSVYRAFTGIPIEKIQNMTPEQRSEVYTKWREAEATRRKELRILKPIYTEIDESILEEPQVVGKKRNVSSKQPRDNFNSPFKKQARKVFGVDEIAPNVFEKENDLYEDTDYNIDYNVNHNDDHKPEYEVNINDDDLIDDFVNDFNNSTPR